MVSRTHCAAASASGTRRTYIERDLPQLGVHADPVFLRRLLTMLAHGQGGLLNASSLGASLGVS